jgi:uncharacterized protein YjbK
MDDLKKWNSVSGNLKLILNIGLMMLDDEQQEEIHDYFMESESDNIENALREFEIMILMNWH